MKILLHPDPTLSKISHPIEEINDGTIELINNMFITMNEAGGIGLSAIQVGVDKQLFIMSINGASYIFINPVITWRSPETQTINEGCLSLPGTFVDMTRSAKIIVNAFGVDGKIFEVEATGLHAACIQHEMDHLSGKTLLS